jgi:hypothetical protein
MLFVASFRFSMTQSSSSEELFGFYGFHQSVQYSAALGIILNQINLGHALTHYSFQLHLGIALPSTPKSFK